MLCAARYLVWEVRVFSSILLLQVQPANETRLSSAQEASFATDSLTSSDLTAFTVGFKAFPLNDVKSGFRALLRG